MFEVLVLGVGDTFSEKHATTSVLLEHDGHRLAIDCPDRYRGVLRAAAERAGRAITLFDIDDLLVTHVHGDHVNGLEGVAYFKHFAQRRQLRLHITPDVRQVLWSERLVASMGRLWDGKSFRDMKLEDYVDCRELDWEREQEIGPFKVRLRRTIHHVPTCALLVTAGGRTLGWSSDTAFDPELIRWLSTADVVIHETNYGPAHTAYADLLKLPEEVRGRMHLIHYPDEHDPETSAIPCLREGQVLAV